MKTGLILISAIALTLSACQREAKHDDQGPDHRHGAPAAEKATLYQCSMHPNIVSDKPGKCPICGMDLQPVTELDVKGIAGRSAVQLSGEQRQLINIRTEAVTSRDVEKSTRAVGMVVYDETKVADITSRVAGWVERLEVSATGVEVNEGQPLMTLYSPALYSAAQDFLIARRNADAAGKRAADGDFGAARKASSAALAESARKRLVLLGLTEPQVDAIAKVGVAESRIDIEAPRAGTVVEKRVVEGQEITPRMPMYRIADLSEVWVEVEIYEYELELIRQGQSAEVTFTSFPGKVFPGEVDFIYPFLERKTRTARVRIALPNDGGLLKPGMYGSAELKSELGESLVVSASAVFDTGRRQYVFVQREEGLFVPVEVELGPKVDDVYVVRSGVSAGDEVVVNGNFLLDSESQLKATASGDLGDSDEPEPPSAETASVPAGTYDALLKSYLPVSQALAADDLERVIAVLPALKKSVEPIRESGKRPDREVDLYGMKLSALSESVAAFQTENLQSARIGFGNFSDALIELMTKFPARDEEPLYVMTCPMWTLSPAKWLQTTPKVVNPYMGAAMLGCGTLTRELP